MTFWTASAILAAAGLIFAGRSLITKVRYARNARYIARQRLNLLKRLLRWAYIYDNTPEVFLRKFREEVSIRQLEAYDILCDEDELRSLENRTALDVPMKRHDLLLCLLLEKGFTPQELSVIYGMKNYKSIYVRCARIRKQGQSQNTEHEKDFD